MNTLTKDSAIVLAVRPLRESDLLVTLLTSSRGKVSAVARGARRSKKRFMGGIDTFTCGEIELRASKYANGLATLESINNREIWLGLRRNLTRFSLASYCIELADCFSHDGDTSSSYYFDPLVSSLSALNQTTDINNCYAYVSQFNLKLLLLAGLDPLASTLELPADIRTWWEILIKQEEGEPYHLEAKQSFLTLSAYTEQMLGHELKSPTRLRMGE